MKTLCILTGLILSLVALALVGHAMTYQDDVALVAISLVGAGLAIAAVYVEARN